MLRVPTPVAGLKEPLDVDSVAVEQEFDPRNPRAQPCSDQSGLHFGLLGNDLRGRVDTEMSLALFLGTPLALGGASLLAHGLTVPSRTCTFLGALAVATVAVVLVRARSRVRRLIVLDSERRGLSRSEGKLRAREYFDTWSL